MRADCGLGLVPRAAARPNNAGVSVGSKSGAAKSSLSSSFAETAEPQVVVEYVTGVHDIASPCGVHTVLLE